MLEHKPDLERYGFATHQNHAQSSCSLQAATAPSESTAIDVMELLRDVPLSQPLTPLPPPPTLGPASIASRGGVPGPLLPRASPSAAGCRRRLERLLRADDIT